MLKAKTKNIYSTRYRYIITFRDGKNKFAYLTLLQKRALESMTDLLEIKEIRLED